MTEPPIPHRKSAKSIISGSLAAFSIVVVPLARHAAIIRFSVAPTLGKSKYILVPTRPFFADASTNP